MNTQIHLVNRKVYIKVVRCDGKDDVWQAAVKDKSCGCVCAFDMFSPMYYRSTRISLTFLFANVSSTNCPARVIPLLHCLRRLGDAVGQAER